MEHYEERYWTCAVELDALEIVVWETSGKEILKATCMNLRFYLRGYRLLAHVTVSTCG